ncbi:granzyme A [Meriones unguiculatus]|uniref:granzyme A n=1 Tax=Meriones unguiculatus TaxID=10047 RepID=UPI00293E00D2|nr:granzyme A [Meriones unguiculatus]
MMKNFGVPRVSALATVFLLLLISEGGCVRIIGGDPVVPHSRPYMVLLKLSSNNICAGALIANDWVLTAAHCTLRKSSQVILGAHSKDKDEPEKQIVSVKKVFPYPRFDQKTHEGDLQLLQLNKKARINRNVGILDLPKKGDDVKPRTRCQVAGWGSYQNNSPASPVLREVNITVIDRKTCNDEKHYNSNPVIGLNMICAGAPRGGKDSCNGDSGSPLICEGSFRGITAFGREGRCGDPQAPGVYTFLSSKYLRWIKKTMKRTV